MRDNRIVARGRCVPYELSIGGHERTTASELDGLVLDGKRIDSDRPPPLRNVGPGVAFRDRRGAPSAASGARMFRRLQPRPIAR